MISWLELTALLNRPIAFHRIFADIGGGAIPGLFLSQAFYWTGRTKDGEGWFYKTQEDWQRETALTRAEQESARKKLRALKILEERKEGLPCKLYFRVNKEILCQRVNGSIVPEMGIEEFITIYSSTLLGLSKSHLARAEKLGCENEFVDYRDVLRTHGLKCCICLSSIKRGIGNRDEHLVFDHFIPLNKGGTHTAKNVFPAHAYCNTLKNDTAPGEHSRMSQQNIQGCPVGTNKQVLLEQTGESYQDKQVSPLGASNLYTEITPEITPEITTEIPPLIPQEGKPTSEPPSFSGQQDPEVRTQLAGNPDPPPPTPSPVACDNNLSSVKKTKKILSQQEAERFLEAYQTEKPSNFTNHQRLSDTHARTIKRLMGSYGGDRALEIFKAALMCCREQQDSWWRNGNFSLNNFASNGKLEDYADKHYDAMERDAQYRARVEGRSLSMDVARHHLCTPVPSSAASTFSKDSVRPVEQSSQAKIPQSFYKAEVEALQAKLAERANEQKKPERPKQSITEIEAELKALLGK